MTKDQNIDPKKIEGKFDRAYWKELMEDSHIERSITRIAHEILESNKGANNIGVVGIRTRGEELGRRLVRKINEIDNVEVPFGVVDITLYRDDLGQGEEQPLIRGTSIPFHVDDYHVILVDDVLFTGRTVRSALDAVVDFGRPKSVKLAVLCDRGHRELPIKADYVGKNIPTEKNEFVRVHLKPIDEEEGVFIHKPKEDN